MLAMGTTGWYGDVALTQRVGMAIAPLALEGHEIDVCAIVVVVVGGRVVVVSSVVVVEGTVVVVVEEVVDVVVAIVVVAVDVVVVDVVVVVVVEHDGSAGDVAIADVSITGERTRRLTEATVTTEHRRIQWCLRRSTRQTYSASANP